MINLRPVALLLLALGAVGCGGATLVHAGYAVPNKVWYEWVHSDGHQLIVVCDVAPDGAETHCKESNLCHRFWCSQPLSSVAASLQDAGEPTPWSRRTLRCPDICRTSTS